MKMKKISVSAKDDEDDDHMTIRHRSQKDHGDVLNAVHTHRIEMKDISTRMKKCINNC